MLMCFFCKAEDGIRDWSVTGVQTCALPILHGDDVPVRPAVSASRVPVVSTSGPVPNALLLAATTVGGSSVNLEIGRASCRESGGALGVPARVLGENGKAIRSTYEQESARCR